jgi:caffeoyl-CoA O-methyltransferase
MELSKAKLEDIMHKERTMFNNIPDRILSRMKYLEEIDSHDRSDGTTRMKRLRQIPPEVGKFIALLAAVTPEGLNIEIGTSAGYSTLWLSLSCRTLGRKLSTYEILEDKAALARETFSMAGVGDIVDFNHGDILVSLPGLKNIAFCFLDAEKEIYAQCYESLVPNMVPGGILVADNAISHEKVLRPMLDRALADDRVDALIVPIGQGELVCRRI